MNNNNNNNNNKLKTKLNGKNTMKAINTYATPVLIFSFGIVKWSSTDVESLQTKTGTLLTRYRFHHPHAAKERLTTTANGWKREDRYNSAAR